MNLKVNTNHSTPTGMAIIQNTLTNASENAEKLEPLYIAGGNVNVTVTVENSLSSY